MPAAQCPGYAAPKSRTRKSGCWLPAVRRPDAIVLVKRCFFSQAVIRDHVGAHLIRRQILVLPTLLDRLSTEAYLYVDKEE